MATYTITLSDAEDKALKSLGLTPQGIVKCDIAPVMNEQAKVVDGKYRVFKDGSVWVDGNGKNYKHGRFLKQAMNYSGYMRVVLNGKNYSVHRLVADAYIEKSAGRDCVNHKNGIKSDNTVANLEWVTRSENSQHRFKVLNQKVWNRALTDDQANEIRKQLADGVDRGDLAKAYGVNRSIIKAIHQGKTYKGNNHA
jgi:hypothetical protein